MKKLLLFFAILSFIATGCAVLHTTYYPTDKSINNVDLRKYSDKGFLFTTDIYPKDYDAVGIVSYSSREGANQVSKAISNPFYNPDFYGKGNGNAPTVTALQWDKYPIYTSDGIDSLYKYCVGIGADAIERLTINYSFVQVEGKPSTNAYDESTTLLLKIDISGFAIKRKK